MNLKQDVLSIYNKIINLKENKGSIQKLPSNAYYLDQELVLVENTLSSGARFPYAQDGLTIWAYASGYISINHSSFYVLQPVNEGKEPYIDFFAVEKDLNGKNIPISLLGVSINDLESNVHRFTVYSKTSAYYLTKTSDFLYAVNVGLDENQSIYFNLVAINQSNDKKHIHTSAYMNMLLKYTEHESVETKWFKTVAYENDTFVYQSPEDISRHQRLENYGVVKTALSRPYLSKQITTSKSDYNGSKHASVRMAKSLRNLSFNDAPVITNFNDTAINGDLYEFDLEKDEDIIISYKLDISHDTIKLKKDTEAIYNLNNFNQLHSKLLSDRSYDVKDYKMEFKDLHDKNISDDLLNQFIKYVNYQVEFAGLSSNSGTVFLGVRDVMQQLESLLIWSPKKAREKMIEVLTFVDPSGLPPRQYAIPPKNTNAKMDLRPFIDQGLWIITTLYTYLAYTNDYSILDVLCPYYERIEPNEAKKTDYEETVLQHLIKISDYLISQIDKSTNCLKANYGDWNDALDGLGLVEGKTGYGNGVSVMASLQLFDNLNKMIEILNKQANLLATAQAYQHTNDQLLKGILEHAIVTKNNNHKIIHGWGNDKKYLVGSYNDPDNQSRDSLTSNAYFVISKIIKYKPEMKKSIIESFRRLDSKYGLKTFEPDFKNFHGFGRIINLPKGTAENAATYIHASLFGIWSLYLLGESNFANDQLLKMLPLNHKIISTSPFVMSNSYIHNEELNLDGESMSDWYTGSANTLLKTIIKGLFGIEVSLETITIRPANEFISKEALFEFMVEGKKITVKYNNKLENSRKIYFNGKLMALSVDDISHTSYIVINKKDLIELNEINIID